MPIQEYSCSIMAWRKWTTTPYYLAWVVHWGQWHHWSGTVHLVSHWRDPNPCPPRASRSWSPRCNRPLLASTEADKIRPGRYWLFSFFFCSSFNTMSAAAAAAGWWDWVIYFVPVVMIYCLINIFTDLSVLWCPFTCTVFSSLVNFRVLGSEWST